MGSDFCQKKHVTGEFNSCYNLSRNGTPFSVHCFLWISLPQYIQATAPDTAEFRPSSVAHFFKILFQFCLGLADI